MAKIPQGEWNAIAARYAKGETLADIARDYGCTPPAIHYILKRVKRSTAEVAVPPAPVPPQAATAETRRRADDRRTAQPAPPITTTEDTMSDVQAAPVRQHRLERVEPRPAAAARPAVNGQRPQAAPPKPAAGRPPALTSELDAALQAHAEAAIQGFRSSFAAALAEGSPASREQLRQAAAELMRAAARTTIVLDRMNAGGKRAGFEVRD
jgi:transposase-like protein